MDTPSRAKSITKGLLLLLPLACTAETADVEGGDNIEGCRGGKCDANDPVVCEVGNRSGAPLDVAGLSDPIANLILKGGKCPESYAQIVEKLNEVDPCDDEFDFRSAAISETAQAVGEATTYRTVTTRTCNGRSSHEMLFSLFGIQAGGPIPSNVEVIAFDKAAGVFNYYTLEQGDWEFHGNSTQFVDDEGGRCRECHTGGGLIMKEHDLPWVHWEGETDTPGVADLISDNADLLGEQTDGAEIEIIMDDGNAAWIDTRMDHVLASGDLEHVLKPLFCDVEINLDSATSFPGEELSDIPADALVTSRLFGSSVSMDEAVYEQALADAGQVVREFKSGQVRDLKDKDGDVVTDTIFKFTFPERAIPDREFVDALMDREVVTRDFVHDVLAIDFTRPVFSDERCGLLRFAPEMDTLVAEPEPEEPEEPAEPEDSAGGPDALDTGDCCNVRDEGDGAGCSNSDIEQCVCDFDDFCCNDTWDDVCVSHISGGADDFENEDGDESGLTGDCTRFLNACSDGGSGGGNGGGGNGGGVANDLAQRVTEGFIANLEAAGARDNPESPEGQFLIALETADDRAAHLGRVDTFIDACEERDEKAFMDDMMVVMTQRRDDARKVAVLEFPINAAALPFSSDVDAEAGARLHPLTCELENDFVGVITAEEPEPEPTDGCLHIAEVLYDVSGAGDNTREWIKLYNACDASQDLDGLSLAWGGKDYLVGGVDLEGSVQAKSCFIVGAPTSEDVNGEPASDMKVNLSPNLQNSGSEADALALMPVLEDDVTTSTVPLDAVIYGGSNDNGLPDDTGNASAQPHVGDASAGSSIALTGPGVWEIRETPTPAECPDF